MIWKFNQVYNPRRQFEDHQREVRYRIRLPENGCREAPANSSLFVHQGQSPVFGDKNW
jgi:magnesium-protoporphyrin IX monomethyl ester (oxidative) cyclase